MKQRGEEQRVVPIDEAKKEGSSKRTRQIIAEADKAIDDTRRLLDEIRERRKKKGNNDPPPHSRRPRTHPSRSTGNDEAAARRDRVPAERSRVHDEAAEEPDPEKETEAASE